MKSKFTIFFGIICLCTFVIQSCIDKNYNWDNIDKNAIFKIPPIMVGSIDTIYLDELIEGDLPEGIPASDLELALSDTISGIFEGKAIKDFFFEGADTVKMEGKADVDIEKIENFQVTIYFNIINYQNERISEIIIPQQILQKGKNQPLIVKIEPQYMKYMKDAKSLELTIVITSGDSTPVQIIAADYIFIKDIIVKTGGYRFEF